MPKYDYQCPTCGVVREVIKPMAEASRDEYCTACFLHAGAAVPKPVAVADLGLLPMRRLYRAPGLIIRPHGYHLKPGEPGYWEIGRALEVGHVPTPDANSRLGAGAPTVDQLADDTPDVELDDGAMRRLNEAVVATYGEPGDAEAARVWHEARTNGYGAEAG